MVCYTTVAIFNVSLFSSNCKPVLTGLFSEYPVVAVAAALGSASFSHVCYALGCWCCMSDAVQLGSTALVE
jgi:hypothetical protein